MCNNLNLAICMNNERCHSPTRKNVQKRRLTPGSVSKKSPHFVGEMICARAFFLKNFLNFERV